MVKCATSALLIGLLLVLCAGGCTQELSPEAQSALAAGKISYQAGDDAACVGQMNRYLTMTSSTKFADEGYYWRGLSRLRQRDYVNARGDFSSAIEQTGRNDIKGLALKGLGDVAFATGDMPLAVTAYGDAIGLIIPREKPADEARFRLGVALQLVGRWTDADLQFSRLIFLFEGSDLAAKATRLFHATGWTVQAGAFKTRAEAQSLASELKSRGLPAEVKVMPTDAGPTFAVHSGRYETYDKALAQRTKVGDQATVVVTK